MAEIITRNGFSAPVKFLSFTPSFYLNGEELFFTCDGALDFNILPLEIIRDLHVESPLFSTSRGGGILHRSINFALPETTLHQDFTRLSAHFGTEGRQRYSLVFLKRLGSFGAFGASASQMKGDNPLADSEFAEDTYSAIAWAKWRNFKLSMFGLRNETKSDISSPSLAGWPSSTSRLQSDARLIDGALSYSLSTLKLALRYNHQDEKRRHYGFSANEDYYRRNLFNMDKGSFTAKFVGLKSAEIDILAGARNWTFERHAEPNEIWWDYYGTVSADIRLSSDLSAFLSYRAEIDKDENLNHSPALGLRTNSGDYSTFIVNCFYREGSLPLQDIIRPTETRLLLSPEDSPRDSIIFRKTVTRSGQIEKTLGAEGTWIYALPTGMKIEFRAGYTSSENPAIWSFERDSVSENLQIVEWKQMGNGDRLTMIPLRASFKYRPDELFEVFAEYQYNRIETDSSAVFGVPKHRAMAYAQEARKYWDGTGKLTMRLEGEAIFGLKNADGGDIDPTAIARAELRFDYLTFTIFTFGEYAFAKTGDGWKAGEYYLDTFPGGGFYPLPKWSLRAGIEWVFID